MLTAKLVSNDGEIATWHVQGKLRDGRPIDALLECEVDGREGWYSEDSAETQGSEPGDDVWDELIAACG